MMQHTKTLLSKIKSPQDIKKLKFRELKQLAGEIRDEIVKTVARNGGHLASNLGVVELSIALHKVFDSPKDKIVWDVGHQCYAHKMLTGRFETFYTLRKYGGLAGFPKRSESPHDVFNTGHASTSISAALGILAAEQKPGGKNHAIAVLGDGALTGGLAYEALSPAGHLALPLIVILNDNKMSISPNVGGLSKYLSRLTMKKKYQVFRRHFDEMAKKIPFVGKGFFNIVLRLKRAVKAVFYIDNFFVDLGFDYVGPIEGHNIQTLLNVFEDVRKINRPVVVHVVTRKGKGYGYAEEEPGDYHGVGSFSVEGGINTAVMDKKKTFTEAFSGILLEAGKKNKNLVAITAAMQTGTGLSVFAKAFPGRFYDVGIAEGHAVTFAAGLASCGIIPVIAMYSTFIQRAVDQVIHDCAMQKLPVIFALDRAGFVSADGETHQGLFDITLFRSVPNLTILAPASENELRLLLDWAINSKPRGPVIIRYAKTYCPDEIPAFLLPPEAGRGVMLCKEMNAKICLVFTGSLYREITDAQAILKEFGIISDIYNLRFIKPIDETYLAALMNDYELTVFIEEGMQEGGFGEYAASLALRFAPEKSGILVMAVKSGFFKSDRVIGTREELLSDNDLDGKGIAKRIIQLYNNR